MNRPSSRQPREPVRKPWIWVVLAAIVLVSVPWYWPPETIHPIVFGLPLWALVTLVGSIVLCGFLSWVCRTQWETPEDERSETWNS